MSDPECNISTSLSGDPVEPSVETDQMKWLITKPYVSGQDFEIDWKNKATQNFSMSVYFRAVTRGFVPSDAAV